MRQSCNNNEAPSQQISVVDPVADVIYVPHEEDVAIKTSVGDLTVRGPVFEVDQIIYSIAQEQSARATADDFTIPEPEWTREAIYHLSRVLRRRCVILRLIESFIRLLKKISYSNSR